MDENGMCLFWESPVLLYQHLVTTFQIKNRIVIKYVFILYVFGNIDGTIYSLLGSARISVVQHQTTNHFSFVLRYFIANDKYYRVYF
jgi:hypothetical protein